jgi:hypothetical protein
MPSRAEVFTDRELSGPAAWPADPLFYDGWSRRGSRQRTTSFAIEAHNLYRASLDG